MIADNQRLALLINLITPNTIIADIGTDHAYLPIESIKQKKVFFAYAADINKKPLEQAEKNIKKAKLTTQIKLILSDGLTYFKKKRIFLDYVVIAGLGAGTIKKILKGDYPLVRNYLICSNTEPTSLRKLIKKKKWFIKNEFFFLDNKRKYWIINISKEEGKKVSNNFDLFIGTNKEQLNDPEYLDYLKKEYTKNLGIIKISSDRKKKRTLKKINKQILKVI